MTITTASTLTSFKRNVTCTSVGIFRFISVLSFHTTGIVGIRIQIVENETKQTIVYGLKGHK